MGKWWKQFWCVNHIWQTDTKEDLPNSYETKNSWIGNRDYKNWACYQHCLKCDKKRIIKKWKRA